MRKVLNILLLWPNFPLMLGLAIYVGVRAYSDSNFVELEMMGPEDAAKQAVGAAAKLYPKTFAYLVSFTFYVWLFIDLKMS